MEYLLPQLDRRAIWSAKIDISAYVVGYSYIQLDGFSFPLGDYFELDVYNCGITHAVWGEGLNYDTPGSIEVRQGEVGMTLT